MLRVYQPLHSYPHDIPRIFHQEPTQFRAILDWAFAGRPKGSIWGGFSLWSPQERIVLDIFHGFSCNQMSSTNKQHIIHIE